MIWRTTKNQHNTVIVTVLNTRIIYTVPSPVARAFTTQATILV
jgi:hypothetical protein